MSYALLAGVSGLRAHQRMIDVAGNNLANLSTAGFKCSRAIFADLLSQTLQEATQPSTDVGGTNPQQIGSGVRIGSVDRNISQGSLLSTGRPLDLAIEGNGLFLLNDGSKNVYTRVGAFSVDADNYLVDPATGYRVQRIGTEGEVDGFQQPTDTGIRIPYDMALAGRMTENVMFTGNLSADAGAPSTANLRSGTVYTAGNSTAVGSTLLTDFNETSGLADGDTIDIAGTDRDGNPVSATFTITAATSTLQDLLDDISTAFPGSTAFVSNGEIYLRDDSPGFSRTDVTLDYTGAGSFELSNYFQYVTAGGEATKTAGIEIVDSQGVKHMMSATFVRQDNVVNQWDLVINSVTGDVDLIKRRINDIAFNQDGSFAGLVGSGQPQFEIYYDGNAAAPQVLQIDLGTVGEYNGITQFGGTSTAAATDQDGYESGNLASLSVNQEGVIVGVFSNGILRDIASMAVATFRNPAGLAAVGANYFISSPNSGEAVVSRALSGGSGSIRGGSLENSNVDMANEFVDLIRAQRGFQANARTITVSDEMLRELANLIR